MKKIILVLIIVMGGTLAYSQTEAEKKEAYTMAREGVKLMDEGEYSKSIKLLTKSQKLDPTNYIYPYEIAYAYHLSSNNKKAIKKLNEVLEYDKVTDECYTLLGNIHDMEGEPEKAIEIYEDGLVEFPNSGRLYFERGIVLEVLKKYDDALESWEKGLEVQPGYPSNYYAASKYFCNYTTEKIWGVLYSELFMNIERGSERTAKLSKLLYDTYAKAIKVESKKELNISFSKQMQMSLPKDGEEMKLPFSMEYEVGMSLAATFMIIDEKNVIKESSIATLTKIRTNFIEDWFKGDKAKKYPNALLDYQKQILDLGHFEAYSYWLLMKGNEEEYSTWYKDNKKQFDAFINWFSEHPMVIDETHHFYRNQY